MYRKTVKILLALAVLTTLPVFIGQTIGIPLGLAYVETSSMSPTMEPGDGFISIPTEITGPVEEGDVIIFQAEQLHGGKLTTHRVVGETDRGYITKGDANPFTDQDGKEEPPVKDAQIVAKALQINGNVVVIPHLGDAATGIQSVVQGAQRTLASLIGTTLFLGTEGLAYFVFVVSLLYYVVTWIRNKNKRMYESKSQRKRNTGSDIRLILGALALLLVIGSTLPMVIPAGTEKYGVVSAEFESDRPSTILTGQSKSIEKPLGNGGFVPVVVYLEPSSKGVDVQSQQFYLSGGAQAKATITLHAPDETGYYRRFVSQHRYLAILPTRIIHSLYQFHPWAPIVVIDALIGIPFYLIGVRLVGTGRVKNRSRSRDLPLLTRCRRLLRRLY